MPTLHGTDSELKRQEIKAYFQDCYKRYESLFDLIADETAYFQKADPLRHPIISYYGHTAIFFINKFKFSMFSLFCKRKSHNIIEITV